MNEEMNRAEIERYLAQRDCPCPRCHYNLRGLKALACPECGLAIALSVATEHLPNGAFLTSVAAVSAGVGYSTLTSLQLLLAIASGATVPTAITVAFLFFVVVSAGLLCLLLAKRNQFRRQSRTARVACASACGLSPFAGFMAVALLQF